MVDVSSGYSGRDKAGSRRLTRLLGLIPSSLSARTSWGLAALLWAAVLWSFYLWEGLLTNVVFTAGVTGAIGAVLLLLSRRPLFAAVAAGFLVLIINGTASAKQRTLGMVLHAYDIVFYLGSWSTIAYLWFAARAYVIAFVIGLALLALSGWLAWRFDGARVARRHAVAVLAVCVTLAATTGLTKADRRQTQFYWNALYVSSFYSSWAETIETLWRGQLIEAAEAATAPPFVISNLCEPAAKPPHIVLIHQESIVQPSLFPQLSYDRSVDPFFKSSDGRLHRLRVETYGGASWLTEFSILTGLSTHSFGGMRPFVQSLLAGKVRDTLPEVLQRCGYRNVLFYPMLKNFVSNGRFYDAVGLREVFDLKAQGAKSEVERDRFYYANALDEMGRHFKTSGKPLFTFIQTMSAHWPYDYTYEPEMKVPGGGPGTDPEMHEYLRRLSMAKLDYDYLKAEIARRFPNEPVLIMHYGDHHPMATRKYLGFGEDTQVEEMEIGPDSIGFQTYYAVEGINYQVPPIPAQQLTDVPYLGAVLLQLAGLPLNEAYKERLRLMSVCDGRYHGCKRHAEILAFHRRLIESNIIDQR